MSRAVRRCKQAGGLFGASLEASSAVCGALATKAATFGSVAEPRQSGGVVVPAAAPGAEADALPTGRPLGVARRLRGRAGPGSRACRRPDGGGKGGGSPGNRDRITGA